MYFRIIIFVLILTDSLLASVGFFSVIKGDVHILRNNRAIKAFQSLKLESKDIVSTSKNALAKIVFDDKTVITLGQKSTFKIEEYFFDNTQASQSTFKVTKGFFRVITGQIGKVSRERFQLKTRNATIGIRGTVFEGTTGAKGDYIACISHAIVVCAAGICQDIKAGEYTFVLPAKAPREPSNITKQRQQIQTQTQTAPQSQTTPAIQTENITQQSENYNQTAIATAVTDEVEEQKAAAKTQAEEYEQIALQAQQNALQAAQTATEAANSANEAFNRIVTAKENVSAYEVDAYVAAQAAADAASSSQNAQNIADEIHQLKLDVTDIESLASEELSTVQNQAEIALQKSDETTQKTEDVRESVQSAQTSEVLADINTFKEAARADSDAAVLLSSEAQTASDNAVQASLSVQEYKDQAVQIESDAAAKLIDVQSAQTAAETAAEQAKSDAAAAAAAAATPPPDNGGGELYNPY